MDPSFFTNWTSPILYPATQKVAGYYVIHSEPFECLREVFQKCIEYIGKILIQMREVSKFW